MTDLTKTGLAIREFRPGDAEAFRVLNEAWIEKHFRLEEKDRETLNQPERYILHKGGHIFMAERDGQPVGCCALLPMDDGAFEVAKMTVIESERGKGLGRELLEEVVAFSRRKSIPRLYLETNTKLANAVRLYELVGFRHLPEDQVKPSPYERANVFMEMNLKLNESCPFLASDAMLRHFVQQWEGRTLPRAEWTHGAHVGVCAFYTAEHGPEEALRRMRDGIPLYNVAVGGANTETSGYHETLTCFWAQVVAEFLETRKDSSTFDAVSACVLRYGQERKLHEAFYSFDVVADRHARYVWVAPDVR